MTVAYGFGHFPSTHQWRITKSISNGHTYIPGDVYKRQIMKSGQFHLHGIVVKNAHVNVIYLSLIHISLRVLISWEGINLPMPMNSTVLIK